jgi:uncharacterized RDD family membrane protein YckC
MAAMGWDRSQVGTKESTTMVVAPEDGVLGEGTELADIAPGRAVPAQLAGVGRRAAALVIDGLVSVPLLAVAFVLFGSQTPEVWTSNTGSTRIDYVWHLDTRGTLLFMAAWLIYAIAMEARFGATIGKMILGLRVVNVDGSPITLQAAIIRNLLRIVDGFLFYLVGAVLAWNSPLQQRLGDRVAGTIVVRQRE